MKKFVLAALLCPAAALAAPQDFPTIDRHLFVNECMQENGGSLDAMYKCSCVMDQLAANLTYEQFQDGDVAQHGANTGGKRAALFRDPDSVKQSAKTLSAAKDAAAKACNFTPKKR
ncbi:MAG: hypothetical protein ACOYMX_08485 [Burkholderiales bacterium]|jgi:hypothetical protein|nr:hypothetical protein [Betaproteobacteria bacterium]